MKILINDIPTEQVSNFQCLPYDITYHNYNDIITKLALIHPVVPYKNSYTSEVLYGHGDSN